jgi:hypothetical protein
MHDLIFAVAFVAMVATPAMVAAIGGRKEFNPGPGAPSIRPRATLPPISVQPFKPVVRPRVARRTMAGHHRYVVADGPTLPMHNARGMANR